MEWGHVSSLENPVDISSYSALTSKGNVVSNPKDRTAEHQPKCKNDTTTMPRKWERKTGRGSWSEESMKRDSIKSSSKKYGIPFSTLQERKKKNKDSKPHLGQNTTFTTEQEQALAERIKTLANVFYGLTATDVRRVAYDNPPEPTAPWETAPDGTQWLEILADQPQLGRLTEQNV
ncbi:hypothetical protein J437_LFUL018203 [Ladona fulva]|uniref:HTH psq-type domain-containing protein n=1 Tax=Ladona fulva TaxID=123851 RepID=A0A8K0KND6_LADFU|nr:hypothetical protein J437_LFUL018203 [Ladona fulva]